jgi:hypothetical protein
MSELEKLENEIKKELLEYAIKEEAYNKGLNDAWELISKVFSLNRTERKKAFGCEEIRTVVDCFDVKEVLNMLEAYEKEQAEIKVGDVVVGISDDTKGVVAKVNEDTIYILFRDGSAGEHKKEKNKKTGKHIDISKILEQIGE